MSTLAQQTIVERKGEDATDRKVHAALDHAEPAKEAVKEEPAVEQADEDQPPMESNDAG